MVEPVRVLRHREARDYEEGKERRPAGAGDARRGPEALAGAEEAEVDRDAEEKGRHGRDAANPRN